MGTIRRENMAISFCNQWLRASIQATHTQIYVLARVFRGVRIMVIPYQSSSSSAVIAPQLLHVDIPRDVVKLSEFRQSLQVLLTGLSLLTHAPSMEGNNT